MNIWWRCQRLCLVLLLAVIICPALAADCLYPDRHDGGGLVLHVGCGEPAADGRFLLHRRHFKRLAFDRDGLACVQVGSKTYYFRRDGRSRRIQSYDNGCDYFVAGLARAYDADKMVYVDKTLNVVLRPGFEHLGIFDYGHAVVCNGPFKTERRDAEHPVFHGGQCGLIDRQGRLVIPAVHGIDDWQIFRNYVNSHNECSPPPIETEAAAICHARRHLLAEIYPRQAARKVLRVSREQARWWVTFAWCSQQTCNPEVELNAETADFLSIVPGENNLSTARDRKLK
jgi:hypothetical protein